MKVGKVLRSNLLPLNLQFFAEDSQGSGNNPDGGGSNEGSGSQSNSNDNSTTNSNGGNEQPTVTQTQLSAIATREKKEGIRAGKKEALKELGFESEAQAKKAVDLLNAMMKSQKSQEEINSEELKKARAAKEEAEKRAAAVEAKLTILTNGVNADCVDDVMAIATAKVTDDKDLGMVIKEMKKETRYASFFTQSGSGADNNSAGGSGTGNPLGNNNKPGGSGTGGNNNFGASLALEFSQQPQKKSSFFKN